MNNHQQETLPGMPEKKLDFFQQVRKLPVKSERTMALLLTIVPEEPVTMSSKKIKKKLGTLSRSNKIKIVETYSHVFAKLREYDLIQKTNKHHAYSLTEHGLKKSKNKGAIIRFFTPQPPPQLPEKTETELKNGETYSKVTILENQIKTLNKIILDQTKQLDGLDENHVNIVSEKDEKIEELEKKINKNNNILGQYKKLVDHMAKTYNIYGVPGNAVGDQAIAFLTNLQSGLNTLANFFKAIESFLGKHETEISEALKLSTRKRKEPS